MYDFDPTHPEYGINEQGERCLRLDACIVPAVKALWAAGIVTLSCCCGHGDPWGVVTIQTQAGVGQRGAMVMRAERFEELERAEADFAQARAKADVLAVENAELRAAIKIRIYEDGTWNVSVPHEHWQTVEAILAAAPAQRGADILAAADALAAPSPSVPGQQLAACRICRATWRIGQPERHQDIEYDVPCPVVAYRRLRGGRAPEGGA